MRYVLALCGVLLLLLAGAVAVQAQPVMQRPPDNRCQHIPPRWWGYIGCPTATPRPAQTIVPQPRLTATPAATSTPTARPATATPTATVQPTATPTAVLPQPVPEALEMIALVNALRVGHGLNALHIDLNLTLAAQRYAQLLAETGTFSHIGPDGSTVDSRVSAAGYENWEWLGENIEGGSPTAALAEAVLEASRGHYLNLVQPEWKDIGVGFYALPGSPFTWYWTQEFSCRFGECIPFGPPVPTPTYAPSSPRSMVESGVRR